MNTRWMIGVDVQQVLRMATGWTKEGHSGSWTDTVGFTALLPMLRDRSTIGMVTESYPDEKIHAFAVYHLRTDHLLVRRIEGDEEGLAAMIAKLMAKLSGHRRTHILWLQPAAFAASVNMPEDVPLWALADILEDHARYSDARVCRALLAHDAMTSVAEEVVI